MRFFYRNKIHLYNLALPGKWRLKNAGRHEFLVHPIRHCEGIAEGTVNTKGMNFRLFQEAPSARGHRLGPVRKDGT